MGAGFPILEISDGTTTIDLLARDGLRVKDWQPRALSFKSVRNDSAMAHGSAPVMSKEANIEEEYALHARGANEDLLYQTIGDLLRLLEQAKAYWTSSWSASPVWVKAKGPNETNARYAIIVAYGFPGISNPNAQTIFSCLGGSWSEVALTIEHGVWQNVAIGLDTCVQASGTQPAPLLQYAVFKPTASTDDTYVNTATGTINNATAEMRVGRSAADGPLQMGIRFRALTIPAGATIRKAFIRFTAQDSDAGATVNAIIKYESTGSAAFSTYANFAARSRGATVVSWNAIGAWVAGTAYDSPELKTIVQALVTSWVGAATESVFFVEDNASTVNVVRRAFAWDDAAGAEPELHVWWEDTNNPTTFGRAATCLDEVFVKNGSNLAQLTHIYRASAGGVFSANLTGTAAHNLLLNPVANGDKLYLGVSVLSSQPGPFSNLIFDVGVAAAYVGAAHCHWEYWNGAWVSLSVMDDTVGIGGTTFYGVAGGQPFGRTGVNSIVFQQPADWATTAINGETAWWVRCVANIAGGESISTPTQQNRPIYTTLWSGASVAALQVPGDITLRGRVRAHGRGDNSAVGAGNLNASPDRIIMGLRSIARDADPDVIPFQAFLNARAQNNIYVTVSVSAGAAALGASGAINEAASGQWYRYTVAAGGTQTLTFTFGDSYSYTYRGLYHVYLRYKNVASGATAGYYLRAYLNTQLWQGKQAPLYHHNAVSGMYAADLGRLRLGDETPSKNARGGYRQAAIYFVVNLYNPTATSYDIDILDVVLMPADEWLGDFAAPNIPGASGVSVKGLSYAYYLDADAVTMPYYHTYANARSTDRLNPEDKDIYAWIANASEPILFQANSAQRLWVLALKRVVMESDALWWSYPTMTHSMRLTAVSRYLVARGAR